MTWLTTWPRKCGPSTRQFLRAASPCRIHAPLRVATSSDSGIAVFARGAAADFFADVLIAIGISLLCLTSGLFGTGRDRFADRADRPHFDRADARRRNAAGDLDRFIEIARFHHIEAGELFFGFRERTVGDRHFAVAHAHRGRGLDRFERFGGETMAAFTDSAVEFDA